MTVTCDLVADCQNQTGESPLWSAFEEALYWVDIPVGKIFRWHAREGVQSWQSSGMAPCIFLHESANLILCQENEIKQLKLLDDGRVEESLLCSIRHPHPGMRFNDGCCDRRGRLWISSMQKSNEGASIGSLYCLKDRQLVSYVDGLCTPNGLAFSPDGRTMYLSDSHKSVQKIWSFDYDVETGVPSGRRLFVDMEQYPGRPDGATVDEEGGYWICAIDSGFILRFSPKGELIHQYGVPVSKPTKCTFGGANRDVLFVTSLRPDNVDLRDQPLAGGVFALHTGVCGLGESLVKLENV